MNKYKIVITQRAYSDIYECVLFVKAISEKAAKDLYEEIIKSIESLQTLPHAYSDIEGLIIRGVKIKRMPIHHGRYLIIYKVENEIITIYDILDSRKDNSILKL